MRIAIDATSIPRQPAGAGVYAIELVRAMTELDPRDGYAVFTRGAWFDDATHARRNWLVERVRAGSRPRRLLWEQMTLPREISRLGIDVIHSTHHTLPLRPVPARRVVTIHDLTFFRLPKRYPPLRRLYMQTLTRLSARVADAIIVPSQSVRADVARILGAAAGKTHVVYEAASATYAPVPQETAVAVAASYGLHPPYILSVGSMEPGKNRARLIRALRSLRDEGVGCTLAIAGQPAWAYESDLDLIDELGMNDRVRVLGYVTQDDLPALLSAASAAVFPSLYEGFGLPVLEAMACGAPVVTSSVSATAEVAGDAALLVEPTSVPSIADGVRRVLCDAGLRADLSQRGRERASSFTWRRAAEATYAVYRATCEART